MTQLPAPRPDPGAVTAFWQAICDASPTFVRDRLRAGGETAEYARLAGLLQAAHPELNLVVGGPGARVPGGRPEIVISTDGNRALFGLARAVVDATPAAVWARYDVRVLRPRLPMPADALLAAVGGRAVTAGDVRWSAAPQRRNPGVCDLTLFVPGWLDALPDTAGPNRRLAEPVFLFLDHLLGEFTVETQIGAIDWRSDRSVPDGVADLSTLVDYLDRLAAA